jgi:hypothetical protein
MLSLTRAKELEITILCQMNIISFLFGSEQGKASAPWVEQSIFCLVSSKIDATSGKLPTGGLDLPDEESFHGEGKTRWAAGAMDGVVGHHAGTPKENATASRVAELLRRIANTGELKAQANLYSLLKDESVLELIDEVVAMLAKWQIPREPHLIRFAITLATDAPDRGPVKVGLALLGVLRLHEHKQTVLTLGAHDEFTLFAAVALTNMLDDPSQALWQLAKSVDGWGRIQVVERLVPTDNVEIQRWLRLEGYRNSVMYEYLAYTCAVHGELREALEQPSISSDELLSASEVINALISGGPAEGIDDYADAAAVCQRYLEHISRHPPALHNLLTTCSILDYVRNDKRSEVLRVRTGWTEANRQLVERTAANFASQSQWQDMIISNLSTEDERQFYEASRAADYFALDTFEIHWQRVVARPDEDGRWFNVMRKANGEHIDKVVAFAERALPLDMIASGPADELGLGPLFCSHSCLDFVLQDLGRFPGKGWPLIEAGLHSPVVRNRHMALKAIEGWNKNAWPQSTRITLQKAAGREPNDDLEQRMLKFLEN